jgi:thiamine pyrophosphokinase
MRTALVFAGGERPPPSVVDGLLDADVVIAADSGLGHALALGCAVDLVVGDLDSAEPDELVRATAAGAVVEQHPADKDATDLELALDAARARGVERIVVIGGHGGRVDHFVANLLLLASPSLAALRVEARLGDAWVVVVRDHMDLHGDIGDLCSLLPLGGVAHGVVTRGLRFPLRSEDLEPGSTRGVSNVFVEPHAEVSLTEGVLLAVLPQPRKAP